MSNSYMIGDAVYEAEDEGFEAALAHAHTHHLRPKCLCQPDGVDMYVALVFSRFYIKRMPSTALRHSPWCGSYDLPVDLLGNGPLKGSAIKECIEDGKTVLSLGFPFTKGAVRNPRADGDTSPQSVKSLNARLSLKSTLHYLWEESELTKWSPGMAGKRNWGLVRSRLHLAAQAKWAKGAPLLDHLWMPEPFNANEKTQIAKRRRDRLAPLMTPGPARARPLMLLIADVKEFGPARFGYRMIVKHSPDFHFFMKEEAYAKIAKRFESEIQAWAAVDGGHLIAIALFSINASGSAEVEEITLMLADPQWIPIEPGLDSFLVDELVRENRQFVRGLRYNVGPGRPIVVAVLHDIGDRPTALFISPAAASDEFKAALEIIVASARDRFDTWIWRVEDGEMPPLPPRAPRLAQSTSHNLFRPHFLETGPTGSELRIVTLTKPVSVTDADGGRRMMAKRDKVVCELPNLTAQDIVGFGKASDLTHDLADRSLLRITHGEAATLRSKEAAKGEPTTPVGDCAR